MNSLLWLVQCFSTWLLGLHPLAQESDFSQEMALVQAQLLAEASASGPRQAWRQALRETSDLIGVILRSWVFGRKAMIRNLSDPDEFSQPTPWRTALLSLLPFFIEGPVLLALGYLPNWSSPLWRDWIWPGEVILTAGIFWASIFIAARRGFPRWSFPHVMVGVISLAALVNGILARTVIHNEQLLWIPIVAVAWVLITIPWRLFRPFYRRIRQDWTHLSYCLFALVLLASATVDHDSVPTLTLLALMPSLIALLGALLSLRCTTRRGRILALAGSLTLTLPLRAWPDLEGLLSPFRVDLQVLGLFGIAYIILLGLLLAPALVGVVFRSSPPAGQP